MKARITNKYLKNFAKSMINIPYCDLQTLLKFEEPQYYTAGVYGWNTDVYIFDDTFIQTGYRSFTGLINPDDSIIKKYENKAQNMTKNDKATKAAFAGLIKKFINEVKEV